MIEVHQPSSTANFMTEEEAREIADAMGCTDVRYVAANRLWIILHDGRPLTNAEVAANEIGKGIAR
ncbi:MAG: hypothetical protein OXC11_16555 [Rhodospirillales bacterium]|nr:hypothetical protein [Rhodospirillales bacterium]